MRILLILILSLSILSCASSRKTTDETEAQPEGSSYDESFDPLTLKDDDIEIKGPEVREDKTESKTPEKDTLEPMMREAQGFRVQILATKNIETATRIEQEAKGVFSMHDHKTYLVFEPPLYKVRIGDVTDRQEAENIREMAREFGYREAFVVRTKVNVAERQP